MLNDTAANAAMTLRLERRGTSTSAVHATKLPGGAVTTDGMGNGRLFDNTNPSTPSEHYRKTNASKPVADGRKLMNVRSKTGDRCLFNADRMLKTMNHLVIDSWLVLRDGRKFLTVTHRSSPKH